MLKRMLDIRSDDSVCDENMSQLFSGASVSQENPTLLIFVVLNNPYNIIHFSYDIFVQLIQL